MNTMQKYAVMLGLGAMGAAALLLMATTGSRRHHPGMCEEAGKSIDERLKESKVALDNATAHIASVFEKIGSRKS